MPLTPPAIADPGMLVWGRTSAGIDAAEAARRLDINEARLVLWESGRERPSMAQLRSMAELYRRPIAAFYLPEPPVEHKTLPDFRRKPGIEFRPFSPQLVYEIRRVQERREIAAELAQLLEEQPSKRWSIASELPEAPAAAAKIVRATLKVTLEMQRAWGVADDALRGWVDLVQDAGVLVMQVSKIPVEEMRGFAVAANVFPAAVLNGADSPRARIFTLLHEYVHLLRGSAGVCDLEGKDGPKIERYCNEVAAATLMPQDDFLNHPLVAGAPQSFDGWDARQLGAIARRFASSEEAVVLRLIGVGKATWGFYQDWKAERNRNLQVQESEGFALHHVLMARNIGPALVKLAFRAYDSKLISLNELSTTLNVKVNAVSAVRRVVNRSRE